MRADVLLFTTSCDMLAVLTNSLARASFTTGYGSPAVLFVPQGLKSLITCPGVLARVPYFPRIPNLRAQQISLNYNLKMTNVGKQVAK